MYVKSVGFMMVLTFLTWQETAHRLGARSFTDRRARPCLVGGLHGCGLLVQVMQVAMFACGSLPLLSILS